MWPAMQTRYDWSCSVCSAGLCTLIGVIIYISAITEEASSSKPKSSLDEAKFRYRYGPSFGMTVCSFVCCELTGVLAVYLCIVQFRHNRYKRQQMQRIAVVEAYSNDRRHSLLRPDLDEDSRDFVYLPVSVDTTNDVTTCLSDSVNYTRDFSRHIMPHSCSVAAAAVVAAAAHAAHGAIDACAHEASSSVATDAQIHASTDPFIFPTVEPPNSTYRRTTIVWFPPVV